MDCPNCDCEMVETKKGHWECPNCGYTEEMR